MVFHRGVLRCLFPIFLRSSEVFRLLLNLLRKRRFKFNDIVSIQRIRTKEEVKRPRRNQKTCSDFFFFVFFICFFICFFGCGGKEVSLLSCKRKKILTEWSSKV